MTWLIKLNIVGAAMAPLLFILLERHLFLPVQAVAIGMMLLIILVLPAANAIATVILTLRLRLSLPTFLSLVSALSLFFTPALLGLLPLTHLNQYPRVLFAIPYVSFALLGILSWLRPQSQLVPAPKLTRAWLASPLLWAASFYILIISLIVITYPILPDQDPYTWLARYHTFFESPDGSGLQRPLFYYFLRTVSIASNLPAYSVLKYGMPFVSLFALPLLWLPVAQLSNRLAQVTALAIPLFSASSLLYFTTPMPQQFIMIVALGSLAWLAYAVSNRKYIWCAAAFFLAVAGYFYHEIAIIIALGIGLGVAAYLLYWRRNILRYLEHQPLVVVLLLLLLVTSNQHLVALGRFVRFWLHRILVVGNPTPNLLFPAYYTNIDSNQVGWPGISGVFKYYAYYIGPPILFLVGLYIFRLGQRLLALQRRSFPKSLQLVSRVYARAVVLLFRSPAALAALFVFLSFLTISEILPRAFGIALLPERAWIFGGFFAAFPLLTIPYLRSFKQRPWFWVGLLLLTTVSVGGALYVNSLKRYVTPLPQLQSAEWIIQKLPPERRLLATSQFANILTFHASSEVIPIRGDKVCTPHIADEDFMLDLITQPAIEAAAHEEKVRYLNQIEVTLREAGDIPLARVRQMEQELTTTIDERIRQIQAEARARPTYLFFAATHKQNPYAGRPYIIERHQKDDCIKEVLNQYPALYPPVYSDQDQVIIWRVL